MGERQPSRVAIGVALLSPPAGDPRRIVSSQDRPPSETVPTMDAPPTVGIAAFAVDGAGVRSSELQRAPRVRAASMTKPLLCWAAATIEPFATDHAAWEALARPAVTHSDNDATAELWSRVGGADILAAISDLTGVAWTTDSGGEHETLRVMVTADESATAYASFVSDESHAAQQLRRWMREVPAEQTFGIREVAAATLGIPEASVGVKCGWFGGERAHAAVVAAVDDSVLGAVVMTSRPSDVPSRTACQLAAGNNTLLVAVHENLAGPTIRSALARALELSASL